MIQGYGVSLGCLWFYSGKFAKCNAICATQSVRWQTHDLPSASELDPKPVSSCVWVQLHWWHVKLKIKSTSGKPNDGTFCLLMKVCILWFLVPLMLWTWVLTSSNLASWIDLTEHAQRWNCFLAFPLVSFLFLPFTRHVFRLPSLVFIVFFKFINEISLYVSSSFYSVIITLFTPFHFIIFFPHFLRYSSFILFYILPCLLHSFSLIPFLIFFRNSSFILFYILLCLLHSFSLIPFLIFSETPPSSPLYSWGVVGLRRRTGVTSWPSVTTLLAVQPGVHLETFEGTTNYTIFGAWDMGFSWRLMWTWKVVSFNTWHRLV